MAITHTTVGTFSGTSSLNTAAYTIPVDIPAGVLLIVTTSNTSMTSVVDSQSNTYTKNFSVGNPLVIQFESKISGSLSVAGSDQITFNTTASAVSFIAVMSYFTTDFHWASPIYIGQINAAQAGTAWDVGGTVTPNNQAVLILTVTNSSGALSTPTTTGWITESRGNAVGGGTNILDAYYQIVNAGQGITAVGTWDGSVTAGTPIISEYDSLSTPINGATSRGSQTSISAIKPVFKQTTTGF